MAIIGRACAAQIMGVAAGTVLISAPGLLLFSSLAWAVGFDWSLDVYAVAHLVIGFFCAILAPASASICAPAGASGRRLSAFA